jgi:hypothetical protein
MDLCQDGSTLPIIQYRLAKHYHRNCDSDLLTSFSEDGRKIISKVRKLTVLNCTAPKAVGQMVKDLPKLRMPASLYTLEDSTCHLHSVTHLSYSRDMGTCFNSGFWVCNAGNSETFSGHFNV